MTLRLMRQEGVITEAEYLAALRDLADASTASVVDGSNLVMARWSAELYGFLQADYLYDSTQSYTDLAGSGQVARPGTYAGDHPRAQLSLRNSRIGFRFRAPEHRAVRASARFEADLVGDWASPAYTGASGQPTEGQFFASPDLRMRHAYLKVETPVVDVLVGQTWHLFGWQPIYQPNTYGAPGELFSRAPQLRLSRTVTGKAVTLEVEGAAVRPPGRDSAIPEGEAGIRLAFNGWRGVQTVGATGTRLVPASIALTGDVRALAIANYPTGGTVAAPSLKSTYDISKTGGGVAVDAFLPVIPARTADTGNALSLLGEFVYGQGMGDLYSGLSSGLAVPALVPVPAGSPPGTPSTTPYNPQLDAGLVTVDAKGNATVIQWQTLRAGLQYTLPGLDGRFWIAANYANVTSPNAPRLITQIGATATARATTNAPAIRNVLNWFNVYFMSELTPAVRLGFAYAYSNDKYLDGQSGTNHRLEGSAYYVF